MNKKKLVKSMIQYLQKDSLNEGFCCAFKHSAFKHSLNVYFFLPSNAIELHMLKEIPELKQYRPAVFCGYWFPRNDAGKQKRIDILMKIYKEIN